MIKRSLLPVCLFCAVVALSSESWAFTIEPARTELVIAPGKQRGKTITVDNKDSDQPLHLRVYVTDVIFLPDGTNDFPAAGSTAWSCAKWVTLIPQEVDVPAKKTQTMRISVAMPPGAKGGYYGMVFFESGLRKVEGLQVNFRLGGLIDITAEGTEQFRARISNITLSDPKKIEIGIFNDGNVLIRPKGKIKIMNARGKKVKQLNFNPQGWGVLPQSMRKLYTELDQPLASGQYTIKIEVDYGTKYLLVGESSVSVQ